MSDMTPAPRRRPLWRLFIIPFLLLIGVAGWSAFWFYAASQVDVSADAWRAQEAKAGRVYDPKLLIAEFTAPATLADHGGSLSMSVSWGKARASVVGLPAVPQRASLVFDALQLDRVNGSVLTPLG